MFQAMHKNFVVYFSHELVIVSGLEKKNCTFYFPVFHCSPFLDLWKTSSGKVPGDGREMDDLISSSDSIAVLDKSLNLSGLIPYL